MSDASWWERHLGGGVPNRQAPPPPSAPPSYGPAVRWQPKYPPTAPPPPPQQEYQQPQAEPGDDNYLRVRQQGFVSKAPASTGRSGVCPDCGGSNFFKRRWAHTEAAPLCTDCGYNGDYFTQSGSLLNAVGISSSGPVAFARTDNPGGESNFGTDPGVTSDFSWSSVR